MKRPGRRKTHPEGLGGLVTAVLGDLGLGGPSAVVRIAEKWTAVVGSEAAAHSTPHRLRGPTLEIETDSSVWVQTLRLRSPEILACLSEHFGPDAPRELWIRVSGTQGRP